MRVTASGTTRRRSVDLKEVRRKEKRVPVAAKAGKSATSIAGQGQLLRRDRGNAMTEVTKRNGRPPGRQERVAEKGAQRRVRLRS